MTKYIFVTGGVVSSIGKGIIAASLGRLLKNRGLKINIQKFDPYLNIDPGTMSPYQHGEVYVTEDGAETDLDLGHYERFIDINLNQYSSVTAGKVYDTILRKERQGAYDGRTVQVIPHVTNEIKEKIMRAAETTDADIVITEVGGTVGDIEGLPFLEALRQMRANVEPENVLYIHTTLIPYLKASSELKTKPTQHSVKELRSLGIQPNMLVVRTEEPIPSSTKEKLALFCDVPYKAVFESRDVETLYTIPLSIQEQGMDQFVVDYFGFDVPPADMTAWEELEQRVLNLSKSVKIAIVGKYIQLPDAYLSVVEALKHAGYQYDADIDIKWVASDQINEKNVQEALQDVDGIVVPGGFGKRGIDGKILAINYARTHNVPFLGICLGMQLAAVEFARYVANLTDAHSVEIDPNTPYRIIDLMTDQTDVDQVGGTLRLGLYPAVLEEGSLAKRLYGNADQMNERHRHRYEFNNEYREMLKKHGLHFSGVSPDGKLVEVIELPNHPFFIATQAHPEFTSRPNRPNPLFAGLIQSSIEHSESHDVN